MSLRSRLVGAVTLVTALTLGGAFTVIATLVNHAQERQLDDALRSEAWEEAREAAARGGRELAISDRPGPAANDVGPLTKFAAIYATDGTILAATANFAGHPPALRALPPAQGGCFDLWAAGEHLRGVLTPLPQAAGQVLLLAAPRLDLDSDAAFLSRAMMLVWLVAVAWAALVTSWVVRRLTGGHHAVTAVVRRVAAGDLGARVRLRSADSETAQLAEDIDDMIDRLSALVQSQRQFIACAAHELRSPLTTLYGQLSHALRRSRDAEAYRQAISEGLDATRRLILLSEDLLMLARFQGARADRAECLSPAELVAEALQQVAGEAKERGVSLTVSGQGPVVQGRLTDLARMLRNLLENAVRHSPQEGQVHIALSGRDALELRITDQGPGIAEEERERIFEPFYRGSGRHTANLPGVGLGLAIAREIARAHGGEVLVLPSAPGALLLVRLPAVALPLSGQRPPPATA